MEGWAETEFCHPPPNSYAEALTPSVTVFGDRPFREISKIKWYVCKKVALKLNIQKTKIMSSGPITLWQMNWETVETVADFIFLGSKITADGDCSHEIKSHLLLGRKVKMNLDSILKSRDITLPTKVHQVQFSSVQSLSCVWLFATPWTTTCQASLSITNSQSPPKPMSIVLVIPSNHVILYCPLLLLPPVPYMTTEKNHSLN